MKLPKNLNQTDELTESLLSTIPFGINIVDENGKILLFNDIFLEKYGKGAIGQKCLDIIKCNKKQCLNCPLKKQVGIGETATTEVTDSVDGKNYEIIYTGMIFKGKKAYLEIFRDISERKRTEDELQRSETKFRNIFQNSPVGIARFDSQGIITDCNDSYVNIIGSPKEKNVGFNLLTDTHNKRYKDAAKYALAGKNGSFEGEYMTVTSKKKLVLKAEFSPFILANGVLDGGILIIEDFTEREDTKQKLKMHTEEVERLANDLLKFELAVESASDAIVITDPDGKIVYANKIAGVMTGYTQTEMIGKGISLWGRLIEDRDRVTEIPFEKAWNKIKKNKSYYAGELVNQNKNGETYITELHLAPVFNEEKNIVFFVATARDITKIKEVDRAKTEFVSLASHELRTPLAGISLASELLLRNAGDRIDADQREYLTEIFSSTKKMSALISDLLNISRIELGTFNLKKETFNPTEAIEIILDNLKSQFKDKKIIIRSEFNYTLPTILFDKNAFNLITENLLTNAIRYTPEGGCVTVRIQPVKKGVIVEISDTGCGIPPEESDQIFAKLFRATNAKEMTPEGEGLGLYIVKLVADKLGVKVWFEANKTGPGTTFYVSIPLN